MNIRFIKDYKDYKQNKVYNLKTKQAIELVKKGIAKLDKMMTDFKIVGNK